MASFIFEQEVFKHKFIQSDGFKNRAKSIVTSCDSVCPNNTDNANVYRGYTATQLLADTLHNVFGEILSVKKTVNIEADLKEQMLKQIDFEDENLKKVFSDLIESLYFDKTSSSSVTSITLLRYLPSSKQKDFGKFVYDVFLDQETKSKLNDVICDGNNPLDDMVNMAYSNLNVLQKISEKQEYSRIFGKEMEELFITMNRDFRVALDNRTDAMSELEFLFAYYLFIYLSQIAMRFDKDLEGDSAIVFPLFKGAKEAVSEDRECVTAGWRRVEKKTQKIFKHMIVLNMLNCHDNSTPYNTYSDLYTIYAENPEERVVMDKAVDYIINKYTVEYEHDTDTAGIYVDFSKIDYPCEDEPVLQFKKKVKYLFECVSLQLDSKNYRQNVVTYVAGNYNHILKMRFVKSWGQLGQMMMITNEDLITMISICQRTSDRMNGERGLQIRDMFYEFEKRGLYMDGKTRQYVIDYLIQINLIDSKCDSEEAQYVKRIQ